jgi:hypothetical protein
MEEALFKKHLINIKNQKNNKEEISSYIKEKTGIELNEEDIILSKKQIKLNISSVIRQKLFQKKITDLLKQKGYSLKKSY